MPPRRDSSAPERRFFLAEAAPGAPPRLAPDDLHHALHVIRLEVGDRLEGLDGRGAAHPLVVTRVARATLELEPGGEPRRTPAPGRPGAALPAFEVCVSLPKPSRVEALVERLTQLGVARVRPLVAARTPPHGRAAERVRPERLERIAREACKQCGRLWLPVIEQPVALAELLTETGPAALLDARGEARLVELAATTTAPRRLLVGPEGGFDDDERAAATAAGIVAARVGPHVLRIETAAEAGLAILAAHA